MSKITFSAIPLVLIVLLSVFFFMSPNILGTQSAAGDASAYKEVLTRRFMNVGNLIAHATFVEDAIIMEESGNLSEIVGRFQRDEKEITYIHFTDADNNVLVSSDPGMVGKPFESKLLQSGESVVKEENGLYRGGFSITVGDTRVGALYFGARPDVPVFTVSSSPNPLVLIVGIIVGVLAFIIMFVMQRNLEARIVEDINKRQEEVFSPKIESLRKEQKGAQQDLDGLNKKLANVKHELEKMNEQYESRKQEIEANPVTQSIERLKASEGELLKRLEKLKEEEQRLSKEIELITQKREEVRSALEAEKKEERTLHEKLDLIKKKILHLETPKK
jgi:hypothetical protein